MRVKDDLFCRTSDIIRVLVRLCFSVPDQVDLGLHRFRELRVGALPAPHVFSVGRNTDSDICEEADMSLQPGHKHLRKSEKVFLGPQEAE